MRKKVIAVLAVGSLTLLCFGQRPNQAHPYASVNPMPTPTIFGEGVISTEDFDSHPAFTPDGRTLYFLKSTPLFSFWTIVLSRFVDGLWTTPEVAPFSGRYSDADPFITADGKQLYFISRRPALSKTSLDLDIWVMDKMGDGWSEPRNLGAPLNSAADEWYPTLAADGTLYFGSGRPGGKGATDIYRSRLVNGKYQEPENLGDAVNTEFDEYEPYIAPDQSYVIFMAAGRPDGHSGSSDLYISHQKDGVWTKAQNLGDEINSPRQEYSPKVSPDGKYFFFSSARGRRPPEKQMNYAELLAWLRGPRNGLGDIYQVDLRSVITVAAPSGGLGDRFGAPQPPQVSTGVDRAALDALAERIDRAIQTAEPTLRLVTRHSIAPLLMGWKSENEWVSVTVYSVSSSEVAGELLHKILAAPVAELPKEVQRIEVGDEGFLLLPQRGGGAQAVFRSRSFVVQMSATSPELTKRFASLIAAQIPGPPALQTAGQRYKNIQVLKDLPAAQLLSVMHIMRASLGVRCDYCHVTESEQYERDDKETKQSARRMIRMMLEINKTYYDGAASITCNSCHQGQVRPVTAVPIGQGLFPDTTLSPGAKQAPLPAVAQVLERYLQAAGGREALQQITTRSAKGTLYRIRVENAGQPNARAVNRGEAIPMEIFLESPNKFSMELSTVQGRITQIYDGANGSLVTPQGRRALTPAEISRVASENDIRAPWKLAERAPALSVAAMDLIDGRNAFRLEGVSADGRREQLWFDVETGLLRRRILLNATPVGPNPEQIDYEDYRDVSGVKIPFRVKTSFIDDNHLGTTKVFNEVKHNTKLPRDIFE